MSALKDLDYPSALSDSQKVDSESIGMGLYVYALFPHPFPNHAVYSITDGSSEPV